MRVGSGTLGSESRVGAYESYFYMMGRGGGGKVGGGGGGGRGEG